MGNSSAKTKKRRTRKPRDRQLTMPFVRVARPGKKLGRPRSDDSGVWHVKRPDVKSRIPMLITLKLRKGLPSLRQDREAGVFFSALRRVNREHAVRFVHFTIQGDHIHLIVEGDDDTEVARAIQGLAVSLSRRWNKLWNRKGTVFADRYHRLDLATPTQVRNALRYVFMNHTKHTGALHLTTVKNADGTTTRLPYVDHYFSSALHFPGWLEPYVPHRAKDTVSAQPRSWLLRQGYLKAGGRLSVSSRPACSSP